MAALAGVLVGVLAVAACSPRALPPGDKNEPPASDQPRIYIADWANHRLVRINDMQGTGWTMLDGGAPGEPRLRFPVGIAAGLTGGIFVSEQYHDRLFRLAEMSERGWEVYQTPIAADKPVNKFAGSWIAVDEAGRIYTTYDGEHRAVRMDDMRGTNRVAFGREGSGVGEFRYPAGIAVDSQGRIYVADFDNFRIVRVDDIEGRGWVEIGSYGSGEREFINPCGLALDPAGRIYIADQGNDRIVRIDDMQGTNWTAIGRFGTSPEPGLLYAPTGIAVDRAGRIYVTQCSSNHAIVRMDDMAGAGWTVFGSGGTGFGQFASPMGICVQ
jgi:DNA-binding beta-propeller fold protein YncE